MRAGPAVVFLFGTILALPAFTGVSALENLDFGDFKQERVARITGKDLNIPGQRCVYFEWTIGVQENGEYSTYQIGYKSEQALQLSISGRQMELPVSRMRLFVPPFSTTTVRKAEDAPQAFQDAVRDFVNEHGESVLSQYCVEYGRAYHVLLHIDEYMLPPHGPEGPVRRTNKVLNIADSPFVEGKPPARLTPAYRGWSY